MSTKAEELADALEMDGWDKPSDYEVADELRRLAAVETELAECKAAYESQFKELHALKASIGEPVAWIRIPRFTGSAQTPIVVMQNPQSNSWLPLYTLQGESK